MGWILATLRDLTLNPMHTRGSAKEVYPTKSSKTCSKRGVCRVDSVSSDFATIALWYPTNPHLLRTASSAAGTSKLQLCATGCHVAIQRRRVPHQHYSTSAPCTESPNIPYMTCKWILSVIRFFGFRRFLSFLFAFIGRSRGAWNQFRCRRSSLKILEFRHN